jgi:hypothetical protein
MAGNISQVKCFLNGCIAAADDGDRLVAVEKAIAGGAGRNALAHEFFFGGQAKILGRCAGRDNQRVAGIGAGVADQREGLFGQLGGVNVIEDDFGVEALGVRFKAGHQFRALHAVGIGGPIVDIGGGHQLAALGHAGDHHRFQIGAGGIDGGGIAGGAGTQDQDTCVGGCGAHGGAVNGENPISLTCQQQHWQQRIQWRQ